MTRLQRLQLEASEKRQRLNDLLALDELSDEQRAELGTLTTRMQQVEVETRAAIVAEGDTTETRDLADAPDAEMRERLELRSRASLTGFITAALAGRQVSGAEAELQAAAGIGGGIPLELWDMPRPVEHRADAPTAAPGTVGVNLDTIRPAVFAQSIAPMLGIEMPRVESGSYVSATITTNPDGWGKGQERRDGFHGGGFHPDHGNSEEDFGKVEHRHRGRGSGGAGQF